MNDRHPRLRIARARRDRAGASRRAASARRAVALASSGLVLISLAGVLGACAAPASAAQAAAGRHPAPPAASAARDRGVLISATPIARLPESAVAAELRNARYEPGTPALGAGMVRYGIDAYRVIYQTVNATGQPVRASGLVVFPAAGRRRLRLVSFATGTSTYKLNVPSTFGLDAARDGLDGRWSSELFASAGFPSPSRTTWAWAGGLAPSSTWSAGPWPRPRLTCSPPRGRWPPGTATSSIAASLRPASPRAARPRWRSAARCSRDTARTSG